MTVPQISENELEHRLARVELLVLDVDGVLTDGGLYYSETGEELKRFNVKDGMGLKLLMSAGIQVAIITASTSSSVSHRAKKLGIARVFLGVEDKLSVFTALCQQLDLDRDRVAYIGDDVNDLPILRVVGCPIAVADAATDNIALAVYVTSRPGGYGAVREVCDKILKLEKFSSEKR